LKNEGESVGGAHVRSKLRYYEVSGAVIGAWILGVCGLLLAVGIIGTMPLGERLAMFLP
jgi:hypothetical protein